MKTNLFTSFKFKWSLVSMTLLMSVFEITLADNTENFDSFTANNSYQRWQYWNGSALSWSSWYGGVQSSQSRSTSNAMLARNYKNSGGKGYFYTRVTQSNVTTISWYHYIDGTNLRYKVSYATDTASTWNTLVSDVSCTTNKTWEQRTCTIPSAVQSSALYFKWETTDDNSTKSNRSLYIDDIAFAISAASCATAPTVGAPSNSSFF